MFGKESVLKGIQLMLIAYISSIEACTIVGVFGQLMIFLLSFISLVWFIKILTHFLEWIETYLPLITFSTALTVLIPIFIFLMRYHIKTYRQAIGCLTVLLLSIMTIYIELIGTVVGAKKYRAITHKMKENNSFKLQSIFLWLMMIIENLYMLIIVVQFYFKTSSYQFIKAESLTLEAGIDLLYYLIITFTTVGFGDISPGTILAKLITAFISIAGMLFTGILVGCILTLNQESH